ncbi:hypothetical protein QBC42DRAFT_349912 [Cladorrhinum samala]|uniref:Methyltransferase type 11 domain-containing protein n=1 Tax=Cladorrhinum samala TaxID=585594 RepID=A0AAV9HCY6_9PEZI|nr:hypothetical protein QBC42DRAFT_349912 [Cladorrhinum samala]
MHPDPATIPLALSPLITKIHGADLSTDMIARAQALIPSLSSNNISLHESPAESPPFIGDSSIDLIISGEAAHWFDYSRLWPELARVVKPGGTLAFWAYKDFVVAGKPQTANIFDNGNEVPEAEWEGERRVVFDPDGETGVIGEDEDAWMRKTLRLGELEGLIRTFSAFGKWKKEYDGIKSRDEGGEEGDLVDWLFDEVV